MTHPTQGEVDRVERLAGRRAAGGLHPRDALREAAREVARERFPAAPEDELRGYVDELAGLAGGQARGDFRIGGGP
jgi:Zn-dependent M28 family amino/carboxypeptidase